MLIGVTTKLIDGRSRTRANKVHHPRGEGGVNSGRRVHSAKYSRGSRGMPAPSRKLFGVGWEGSRKEPFRDAASYSTCSYRLATALLQRQCRWGRSEEILYKHIHYTVGTD